MPANAGIPGSRPGAVSVTALAEMPALIAQLRAFDRLAEPRA